MEQQHTIITIDRQYGSGGRVIGETAAKKLGIPAHGDDIVGLASRYTGIAQEHFERADEMPSDSLLFMLAENTFSITSSSDKKSISVDTLFHEQSKVIREIAAREDCVIIGRNARYILKDEPGLISVFITSDMEHRISRIMQVEDVSRREAIRRIRTMDKRRSRYFEYYSGMYWDDVNTYDLIISTAKMGIEGAAQLICSCKNILRPAGEDSAK